MQGDLCPGLEGSACVELEGETRLGIAMSTLTICCRLVAICLVYALATRVVEASGSAQLVGVAFVDASITSQGSRARLPPGAKIYPPGSKITGTDGCPTTPYRTDGLIVAIIDYDGDPTAGSLAVTRHPASGGQFENAPYYLDLNPGRTLQFLGPIFDNGTYEMHLTWGLGQAQNKATSAEFTLARNCL